MLSVIVPTISGREASLARTLAACESVLTGEEWELIVVKDDPFWPTACNEGYERSQGEVCYFGADDLEPLPGSFQAALAWLEEHDELPAARVFNHVAGGVVDNAEDGPDRGITWFTRVPILRRDQYERIGPWPAIFYYADVWLSEKARKLGIETRLLYEYAFVHHWESVGRKDDAETLRHAWHMLERLRLNY